MKKNGSSSNFTNFATVRHVSLDLNWKIIKFFFVVKLIWVFDQNCPRFCINIQIRIFIFLRNRKVFLTVASLFGNFLPRGCFSLIASRMTIVSKNHPQGLPLKFEYATFGWIKISGNDIFTVCLTGSGPEMNIFDRMGDFFRVWRSQLSFLFHGTVYQFPVQGTLANKLPIGDATVRRKKTMQLLKLTY